MNDRTRDIVEAIAVYASIFNDINIKFDKLLAQNFDNQLYENEQLFYEIISDLIRILPFRKVGDALVLDYSSGILLLKDDLVFMVNRYQEIVSNELYKCTLKDMKLIRNKFEHEPHNMHASFSVGAKNSFSMGLYYKQELTSISTLQITNIIYELNEAYDELRTYFLCKVNDLGEKYKEYPCYKVMYGYDFKGYNVQRPKLPEWMLIKKYNGDFELD